MRPLQMIGAGAMLFATAAQAQVSTNCIRGAYGSVHCDSVDLSAPPPNNSANAAVGQGIADLIVSIRVRKQNKHVVELLSAGDCQGAFAYALEKQRFDLAVQIRQICAR
jgi:hypothetical protein